MPAVIQGDPGEANRGVGQADPSRDELRDDDAPAPAAGGPGSGVGPTSGTPKHQEPVKNDTSGKGSGTYGQG